ncbi:CU044_2847 family protein, partial [Streptomyces sp. 4F14]|uniref:CU044_2847 family protein n=1 Tax=Streptomyces sp. 4F14 TaxID=3394380 RepID=UPI003A8976F5
FSLVRGTFCFPDRLPDSPLHESARLDAEFEDGTPVRFLLSDVPAVHPSERDDDLPEGMGTVVPVASGQRIAAEFTAGALRMALQPLRPLLREVHDVVLAVPQPPSELSVAFGVQVGQDLRFGIVGGGAQAHLTVTATWRPPSADAGPSAAPAAE